MLGKVDLTGNQISSSIIAVIITSLAGSEWDDNQDPQDSNSKRLPRTTACVTVEADHRSYAPVIATANLPTGPTMRIKCPYDLQRLGLRRHWLRASRGCGCGTSLGL
eukprot:TRINITY_DN4606_c0_g1_i17.p1 TRINITY_DN4606_c0_g1~~TRINITY_DN4606_c0_g1_i17.p1  ORF type:complete len:107 (-),score=0.50 TRINITY_DN4606_c0_g1_i17:212-532(-)